MRRRNLLKALTATPILGSCLFAGSKPQKRRKGAGNKKLVICFQRGGSDGLNTMVPVDPAEYGHYMNLRPMIGLPQGSLVNVAGDGFFGLNPSLAPLVPIINAGNCSMIHAVGYPDSDHSHFEAQSHLETAVPGNGSLDGWLNRYLGSTVGPGLIRGVSIGYSVPQSITGLVPVPGSTNFGLSEVKVDPRLNQSETNAYRQDIQEFLSLPHAPENDSLYNMGNNLFEVIENFQGRNLLNYLPENGAVYPVGLGGWFKHAAQMLKDDSEFLGVEVVTIDACCHDTHSNQVSRQEYNLSILAQSLAAFHDDMGPTRMDDVVVLVISEFGRRAYENASLGTDHGSAGVAFVLGNSVTGGLMNGGANWPGLHPDDLLYGYDLGWVTDFRDIYWEILSEHMGVDPATLAMIVPGHTYSSAGILL